MTPEGRVKAMVDRALKEHFGVRCYKFKPVQNGMGKPGLDYFNCIHGFFIGIETKIIGKNLTPRQLLTVKEIEAAGGHVFVIRTAGDIDAMVAKLHLLIASNGRAS